MYDFYKILEISRDASLDDIRRAYRNKAKLVHPDVNNSPKANEVFAVVSEAYEVLTDERKRYLHDAQLNYADAAKAEAEQKKRYYGSSVKNDSYSNVHLHNLYCEWSNLKRDIYRESSDERHYRHSPLSYNLFFTSGMVVGFIIIIVTLWGTFKGYWPFPFIAISISGFILVREGWKGIMGKKNVMGKLFRKLRI